MLFKVGELAQRCGLTVRTLHHYDAVGLLSPSARSDSGYRLYDRGDVARLHEIQALKRFGLPLADIGAVLADPGRNLAAIVEQQMASLARQLEEGRRLHGRLSELHQQLQRGEEPALADWLTTLEMMAMYDKYFSADEIERLPLLDAKDTAVRAEWASLVDEVHQAMGAEVPAEGLEAQALARRWMAMLVRDTDGDPRLLAKLNTMQYQEPDAQEQSGVTPEMMAYIQGAFTQSKLAIYEKYLSPEEFQFMRANYGKQGALWPPLIGAVRQQLEEGTAPDAPQMQRLAAQWMALFRSYAGDDPQTHAKIRAAHQAEPQLLEGTFIDKALLGYIAQALSGVQGAEVTAQ
ncbi:MerR family transcriptional regulator [Gallaecimonas kandeliae]|uniref:MerR family transcriptional regulator n=1 Tax=Gallaecimonas kandeliae TaxID=3029055 RepID=UPI00264A00B1|nr:MerR family transcriptional regulator [Gallaecimonas kandeliae]WKE64865.1 MerR family transcriptional regulator [Gallaecimonas kandeliae]